MPVADSASESDDGNTWEPTEFAREVAELLRATEESLPPLKVLVWGPGENLEDPWWIKRVQIRDELRQRGYEAAFSEDLPGGGVRDRSDAHAFALKTAEFAHAKVADYIVVLMGSVGAVAEAHDFGVKPQLARKMLVFIDQDHKDGYAVQSLLPQLEGANGKVKLISVPADLDECNVLTTTLEAVANVREMKRFSALEGPE